LVSREVGIFMNFTRQLWKALLYCARRSAGRVRSLFFGFNNSFRGEHRVIVKSKFIFAPGGQWGLLVLDATAAEAQLTSSWIINPSDFCAYPILNESI
jgi:hypothetical protein